VAITAPLVLQPETIADRALTLWQPWAWLVAHGHKNIENRPRGFSHKSFRGEFWIHASQESERSIRSWPAALELCAKILGDDFRIPDARGLAYGAIIGRATITGIYPPREPVRNDLDALIRGDGWSPWHFPDQYGFKLENARALKEPVPCRGYQGFWRVPADVLEKLRGAP